jgi:Anti-sigma factor NepR
MVRTCKHHLALAAVRTSIVAELKRLHSELLREPIPDEMAELLRKLDQPPEGGHNTDDSYERGKSEARRGHYDIQQEALHGRET